jgi:nitrogen fixation protein NifU and related proteins
MSDLRELYQEVILDHNRHPQNFRKLATANRRAEGYNPLCGDQITIYVELDNDNDVVRDVSFEGSGCAISKASASMMTTSVKGRTRAETQELFQQVHAMLVGSSNGADTEKLGKLMVLGGVCEFPSRVKCATLCWHALAAALKRDAAQISTE